MRLLVDECLADRGVSDRLKQSLAFAENVGCDPRRCVVMGSLAAGFKRAGDLDMLVPPDIFAELRARFGAHGGNLNGYKGELVHIDPGHGALSLDVTMRWPTHLINNDDIHRNSQLREGWNFACPNNCLVSMVEFHRPKDGDRILVLKQEICPSCVNAWTECGIALS